MKTPAVKCDTFTMKRGGLSPSSFLLLQQGCYGYSFGVKPGARGSVANIAQGPKLGAGILLPDRKTMGSFGVTGNNIIQSYSGRDGGVFFCSGSSAILSFCVPK